MLVNFVCQHNLAKGCSVDGKTLILSASVRVFLEDISTESAD
jgi:hypothetical protein